MLLSPCSPLPPSTSGCGGWQGHQAVTMSRCTRTPRDTHCSFRLSSGCTNGQ